MSCNMSCTPLVSKAWGVGCPGKLSREICELVLGFDFSRLASMYTQLVIANLMEFRDSYMVRPVRL